MQLNEVLRARANLNRVLRAYFDERGFIEVNPPCLLPECIVDAYIDPMEVSPQTIDTPRHRVEGVVEQPANWFLQTSPELAMKRLLAGGSGSIYALSPVFRGHEFGTLHRPEFSMIEWYEVGADAEQGIATLGTLAAQLFGHDAYETKSYQEAFQDALGIDPLDCDTARLVELVDQLDPDLAGKLLDDRDDLLDILLSQRVQASLGLDQPTVLYDYPISQAALAKPSANDPRCAARFELFFHGIELANGYDELLQSSVLRERVLSTNQKRVREGKPAIAPPESLIDAMQRGLPASAGVAMGVDRVLMILCRTKDIGDVIPLM